MSILSGAGVCLAVALTAAPDGRVSVLPSLWPSLESPPAHAQPQSPSAPTQPRWPPAQTQPQAPPAAQPPPATLPQTPPPTAQAQPPPEAGQPDTRRQRPSRRTPRASRREPARSTRESSENARPSRVAGPTRQELTLTSSLQGGYDDNLTAGLGGGAGYVPTAMASGSTGYFDAALDYFLGNALRSLRVASSGNLRAYPEYLDRPAAGGAFGLDASTGAGQNLTLGASADVSYDPLFTVFSSVPIGTPAAAGPGAAAPGTGAATPELGLFERRSLSAGGSVSVDRRWGRRDSTSLSYSYRQQQFIDDDRGDSTSHEARAAHRRILTDNVRARVEYRYVDREYTGWDGAALPSREHRIEAGPDVEKALSRRRHLSVSLGAGAAYVESVTGRSGEPYQAWVPIGSASATLALSPRWSVQSGYRRDFSLLRGITDEIYTTDTASLATAGQPTARTSLVVSATYANWKTPSAAGVDERLELYGGSLQLSYLVSTKVAVTAGYYYYQHRYSNPAALAAGFPAEYDRRAVRVGLTVWLPLVGSRQPSGTARSPQR